MQDSKTLILQVNIAGPIKEKPNFLEYAPNIYEISNRRVAEYANKIGADYKLIRDTKYMDGYHPAWHRLGLMHDDFNQYDTIIYMDSDYVTHPSTPNLLEVIENRIESFFAVPDTTGKLENPRRTWNVIQYMALTLVSRMILQLWLKSKRRIIDYISKN